MISGSFASSFFIIFVNEYNKKLDPTGVFILLYQLVDIIKLEASLLHFILYACI